MNNKDNTDDFALLCEHFKEVLTAYKDMTTQANGAVPNEDYKEKFYRLLNHKNEVL